MLSDVKSGIQLVIFVIFLGAVGYFFTQALPTITGAMALPAKIEKANAEEMANIAVEHSRATAAPTFIALSVSATAQAIANGKTIADAAANSQIIAAQGIADSQRAQANSLLSLVLGTIALGIMFFVVRALFGVFAFRTNQQAIDAVAKRGGTLLLPNKHEVRFLGSGDQTVDVNEHVYARERDRR